MSCHCHLWSSTTMKNLLIALFLHIVAPLSQGDITCTVPPVEMYHDTVLKCNFPEDLNTTKRDFSVYHYPNDKGDAVVDCWWLKGQMTCSARPEILYKDTVSRTFTITLLNVSSTQTGRYACQIANYDQNLIRSCQLTILSGMENTCSVTEEKSEPSATLTCYFKEDISKTQLNFTMYRHSGLHTQNVAECWWVNEQRRCQIADGYHLTSNESNIMKIMILEITKQTAGNYSCWHGGSPTCFFEVLVKGGTEGHEDFLVIGLILGLVVTIVLVSLVIGSVLIVRRRSNFKRNEKSKNDDNQPMVEKGTKVNDDFQEFLVKSVSEMFPNMLDGCYFVPPIYFNKVRYKTEKMADQIIYIPEPSDPTEAEHDKAMRHFMCCFHHIPKTKKEQMFVLTQFVYEDYLNNPGNNFSKHSLPVPDLKEDKNIGCFDILVIHRHYGLLVGVVKTVSDHDGKRDGDGQEIDHMIVADVSAAIQQLNKADRILSRLIKDLKGAPPIRRILILPNVKESSLKRALRSHNEVAQNLRKCFDTEDNPAGLCLCSDDLSDPETPWNVDDRCVSRLTTWWDNLILMSEDISTTPEKLYQCLIARFCGPATTSCVDNPRRPDSHSLPKSLGEAVSLTGDLFERLYPGRTDLLIKPRVFLAGPPSTGKTKILTLVGRMWLLEGHVVQIINTSDKQSAASVYLIKLLKETAASQLSAASPEDRVVCFNCNILDKVNIPDVINAMRNNAGGKYVCALADDLFPDDNKTTQVNDFFQKLHREFQELYLWAASCSTKYGPKGWDLHIFREPLSCPPTVLQQEHISGVMSYSESPLVSPTDGPPVKVFSHKRLQRKGQHSCESCGEEIVRFLTESLRISGVVTDVATMDTQDMTEKTSCGQPSPLHCRDLLMLFEEEVTESTPLIRTFVQSGIPVNVVSSEKLEETLNNDNNIALAAKTGLLCGIKRKVVVYVEGEERGSDFCASWNRLRGITSCASQLIVLSSKTAYTVSPVV